LGQVVCTRSEPIVKIWPLIEAVAPIAGTDTSTGTAARNKMERAVRGTRIAVPSGSNEKNYLTRSETAFAAKRKKRTKVAAGGNCVTLSESGQALRKNVPSLGLRRA